MFKDLVKDAFPILEKYTPIIATALGSPYGGAAAMFGLNLLGSVFGVQPDHIDNLNQTIAEHPDPATALSGVDDRFRTWLSGHPINFKMPTEAEISLRLKWDND